MAYNGQIPGPRIDCRHCVALRRLMGRRAQTLAQLDHLDIRHHYHSAAMATSGLSKASVWRTQAPA
jgi:hypothetical protein